MTQIRFLVGSSVVVAAALGGAAHAQAVVGESGSPETAPGFLTLDRGDANSRVGAEVSYLLLNDDNVGDGLTALRFDLHGQYVARNGFGFYATVPIGYVSGDSDSATQIEDIELGGLLVKRLDPHLSFVGRAGITLPTASDDIDKAFTGIFANYARFNDYYLAIPGGVSARLAGSVIYRQDRLFARADLGVDINLSASGDSTADPAIRYNVGVGYLFGSGAVTAELTNISITGDDGGSLTQAALSARFFAGGGVAPYVGVVLPIDEDARDAMDVAFTLGVDARI